MADPVPQNISNIRTMEDVAHMLSILFTNLNYLDGIYYDMFINPIPMDIDLKRYDETGKLVTVTLANRAKDRLATYAGPGNPNGVQVARMGSLYVDTESSSLYYKGSGTDSYGWILVWSAVNHVAGLNYLAPNGDGSQLKNLSAANISSGILPVNRGGSGTGGLSGVLKGNGTDPYSVAIDGQDFLGPNSFTGIIAYYPVNKVPAGWLRCDGAAYSRNTYARLFRQIGVTYGAGDGINTFNVPDLRNYFVRGWDGTSAFNSVQKDQVGTHRHALKGNIGPGTPHNHSRGTMNITGTTAVSNDFNGYPHVFTGAFWWSYNDGSARCANDRDGGSVARIGFDASRTWTGVTSTESSHTHSLTGLTTEENAQRTETRVLNKMLLPIIKY